MSDKSGPSEFAQMKVRMAGPNLPAMIKGLADGTIRRFADRGGADREAETNEGFERFFKPAQRPKLGEVRRTPSTVHDLHQK